MQLSVSISHVANDKMLYMANGVNQNAWTPEGSGADFKLSPILQPLEPHKKDILVLTHLTNKATDTGDGLSAIERGTMLAFRSRPGAFGTA